MRRAIKILARLYPGRWRRRYGVEFDALLDDSRGDWHSLADVFWSALKMQVRLRTLLACFPIAGGLVGWGIAYELAHWRIPIELRAADHVSLPRFDRFETCAALIDPGDCG
jgi:hypothetical protein